MVVTAGATNTVEDTGGAVVTITATDPAATTGSDGGVVVVTLTADEATTDEGGGVRTVVATRTTRVRVTYVRGTETETQAGSLQTDSGASEVIGKIGWWTLGSLVLGVSLGLGAGSGLV